MTEKNTATLVVVALIGAFGVVFAACIGLIPTILPMVRPTSTPFVFLTSTFPPSDTPAPETPSATTAPTDLPTLTATDTPPFPTDTSIPTEAPTITPTLEAASSNVADYVGTWTNVEKEPKSDKVKLIVSRMEISQTSNTTANFIVCRTGQNGDVFVQPNPVLAAVYEFGMVARDLLLPNYPNRKWSMIVQQSGEELVATVQEYDENNIILNSDTFRFEKVNLLDTITLSPCREPQT